MFLVPFFYVFLAHSAGETGGVIAGRFVLAGLRIVGECELGDLENALRAAEAIDFRRLGAEVEAEVDGDFAVLEESGVNVGDVWAVFPAEDAAAGEDGLGRLGDVEPEHNSADKLNGKIAGGS